jgi:hypothetical protein
MVRFLAATLLIISSLLAAPLAAQSSREEEQRILEERRQSNPRYQADQQRAQAQAQQAMNNYRSLVALIAFEEKCGQLSGLDKQTVLAANLAHSENRNTLLRLGAISLEQEREYERHVEQTSNQYFCKDLATTPGVKSAIQLAQVYRDTYLLALLEYKAGTNPDSWNVLCSLMYQNEKSKIVPAAQDAKERLMQNPNFANIEAVAREPARQFTTLCESAESVFISDPLYQIMQQFEYLD